MIDAILMYGKSFLGMYRVERPLGTLHFQAQTQLSVTSTVEFGPATSSTFGSEFMRTELMFRLSRQVDHNAYEYQYDFAAENSGKSYTFPMYAHAIVLEEPGEKIHLNQLKAKLRDNLKLKELLINYYADGQTN